MERTIQKEGVQVSSVKDLRTEKLVLVGEGVFPIVRDADGNSIAEDPKTGLAIAGTIQGEGKLAGMPSLFIRLAGCNLRCIWQMSDGSFCRCDTSYASFQQEGKRVYTVDELFRIVKNNIGGMNHVVITGGEPLLQAKGILALSKVLKEELGVHITIESNGTLFDEELTKYVDLFSISPKLRNSDPTPEKMAFYNEKECGASIYHHEVRRNIPALQSYVDHSLKGDIDLQLKFVAGKKEAANEIVNEYLSELNNYKKEDVLIMPLGATHEELVVSRPLVLQMCIENGWRFAPRVHIEIFGSKQGV